ncbi:glycosyltransferase family 2 protein [Candidatus Uhrbacteria bacterium]|nr:glycosyltransferase family 2 protein [Candidatus Uhrbacteria bacterium]
MTDISIISVNYRSADHLRRMVASLLRHATSLSWELFIINHSKEEDLSDVVSDARIHLLTQENRGFASGCNRGIREATGKYLLLLNPDIELTDDSLATLLGHLNQDTEVGIAGVRLSNPDGSPQPSVRAFPTPLNQLVVLLKLPHLFPKILKHYLKTDFDYRKTQDVDQVMGAYFLIRRALIEDIGLLDEGFFYWFEEVDYCKRAKDAGWKIRYYADVQARHAKGGSFSQVRTREKQAVIRRSLRRYIRKHFGWGAWAIFVFFHPLLWILGRIADFVKRY